MAIENKKILTDKFSFLTDISDQSNSIVLATLSSQLSFWGTLSEVQIGILKCYAPIALDSSNNTQDMNKQDYCAEHDCLRKKWNSSD